MENTKLQTAETEEEALSHRESRGQRLRFALALALPFVLLAGGLLWRITWHGGDPSKIAFATGKEGGTYHPYGQALGQILRDSMSGVSVEVLETDGSVANVDLLAEGRAQFAFLQSNVLSKASVTEREEEKRTEQVASFRTVARLYAEVLQVVVPKASGARALRDLDGQRVYVSSSGTAETAQLLFRHFGLAPRYVHEVGDVSRSLLTGEIDAALYIAGLKTQDVEDLLKTGQTRLLSLGDATRPGSALEGASLSMPGTRPSTVPKGTYGAEPPEPVGTLAVDALLVTRADQSSRLVRQVTELLFDNKFQLARKHAAARELAELQDSRGLRFPLHPGAAHYYARNDPPFFVTYAESISLLVTLALAAGSGLFAFREWVKRRRKNRIDIYYMDLDALSRQIRRTRNVEELSQLREDLYRLRRRAFRELVAERIAADESFTIFQDFLGQELREVDRWLDRGGGSPREHEARGRV